MRKWEEKVMKWEVREGQNNMKCGKKQLMEREINIRTRVKTKQRAVKS